ncbi:two component transcriptional regulator, winged helix family [Arcobacter nitrofigilis DSM 7299]|uniref:Two component transcriptional regulator, winged helix family n=1 Tax=Arcobacter nitrofigilis (strain ATCC 33309 / DSM 7299 / CCUG 15893 / LMG 7604 / NCTC 12251 / CI) TaxID=572480 RepID=D5V0D9_ARCNC|nr:response regulator transcription factor [Arcobacter nitrofigilis]ADG93751.1 two component transcriptional regulator, winged helix family [Arcobacter nitrofigilis DSM 7299]
MNILLLEDDFDYRISVKEYLESLDYKVDDFENGEEALNEIYEKTYHLLILDIKVPNLNGYDLVRTLKKDDKNIPVIFITSLTDINNLSMGYELGCNDYIKKPFSLKELKYRVEQVIKSTYFNTNENIIELAENFSYNTNKLELLKNTEIINLTKKEQDVIFSLLRHNGRFVNFDTLREEVWDNKYINEADIRVCIKNIRAKTSKTFIINQRGLGYKIDRD